MKETTSPQWLAEFGPDYAVPDAIAKATDVVDKSWNQDACPSFWIGPVLERDGLFYRVEIWADHPEKSKREFPSDETQGGQVGRFVLVLAEVEKTGEGYNGGECRDVAASDDADEIMRKARAFFNPQS